MRDLQPVRSEVTAFLERMKSAPRGRLIFGLDATMSRQETWDTACHLQGQMFDQAAAVGGLDIQLIYYRGLSECRASRWVSQANELARLMAKVSCIGGHTQIGKILKHVKREAQIARVSALVFVGDAMEEKLDDLCHAAGELTVLGVPAFMFQEGDDHDAHRTFREIARLTKGAHVNFDVGAAKQLAELLRAVAIFASGGLTALEHSSKKAGAVKLLGQLRGRS